MPRGSGSRSSRCRTGTGRRIPTTCARRPTVRRRSSSSSRTSSAASSRARSSPPAAAGATAPELAGAATEAEALAIAHVDPLSLGVLEAPARYGCSLALGEGQAAGNFPAYGGPHHGFLAARQDFIRRMPGRIVGETVDAAGKRGYVLTLQTREQHIRREKATSNITTNQT